MVTLCGSLSSTPLPGPGALVLGPRKSPRLSRGGPPTSAALSLGGSLVLRRGDSGLAGRERTSGACIAVGSSPAVAARWKAEPKRSRLISAAASRHCWYLSWSKYSDSASCPACHAAVGVQHLIKDGTLSLLYVGVAVIPSGERSR